jgi:hypothetical protein
MYRGEAPGVTVAINAVYFPGKEPIRRIIIAGLPAPLVVVIEWGNGQE